MRTIGVKVLVFLSILVLMFSMTGSFVVASELDDINDKISDTKDKIDDVQDNRSAAMKQIQKLNAEIAEQESEISKLEDEIEELEKEIEETEKNIQQKQDDYDANFEKYKVRLVASYEAGQTTYLDVLLSSKKLTDVLSNWYYLSELAKADKAFQESLMKQKSELEDSKVSLETSKKKVESNKKKVEKTAQALKESKNVKQNYINELSVEERELQDELEQFEKDKKEIQRKLEEIAKKNQYATQSPNKYGYISPLAGRTTKDIYCGWLGYPGHKAVDFSYWGINGQEILAVKSGKVVISTALKYSNGKYRSYGEYIVIDHQDGSMTLYAHGIANSRRVAVGDWVSQGQVIMLVGSTGNSTGPHLHFEVRINGQQVNPTPYLP